MKKLIALWSALTVVSALAFVNNVAVIVRWWTAFLQVGGDSSQMPATCPGIIPGFDWSAVDYSAVSTFIPLLGCCCVVRGLVKISRGEVQSAESFPFFPSADQFNVALGLFGTLWGIIIIGYFRLDKVSMGDLMHCLHTALFSTLVAVVWVFMIDHPLIRPWMRKLLLGANLVKTDNAPLADAVDAFVSRLAAASAAFDRRQQAYEEANEMRRREFEEDFNARQMRAEAAFTKRLLDAEIAFAKREKETSDAFAARLATLQEANEVLRTKFAAELKEEQERHRKAEDELSAAVQKARSAERSADETRRAAEAKAEAESLRAKTAEDKLESARAALKG